MASAELLQTRTLTGDAGCRRRLAAKAREESSLCGRERDGDGDGDAGCCCGSGALPQVEATTRSKLVLSPPQAESRVAPLACAREGRKEGGR